MRLLLIVFLFLLTLPFLSSQNITINYPDDVFVGEEFIIKIKLIDFKEDIYDVKIDILGGGVRVAKILNNEQWKSTYYYINDAIKNLEEKDFKLKIESYIGKSDIEIKIRDSSENINSFSGYEVLSENSLEEKSEEINETEKKEGIKKNITEIISTVDNKIPDTGNLINKELKPIKLTTKDIKSENSKSIESLNTTNYGIYGFVIFCVLLIILFVLKKFIKNE